PRRVLRGGGGRVWLRHGHGQESVAPRAAAAARGTRRGLVNELAGAKCKSSCCVHPEIAPGPLALFAVRTGRRTMSMKLRTDPESIRPVHTAHATAGQPEPKV